MAVVLSAENLSKRYTIAHERQERYVALRDVLARRAKSALLAWWPNAGKGKRSYRASGFEEFWALDNVSFEIQEGERIGIIGKNGAGKSTLLKVLSRITEPTRGRVTIVGQVTSLLEVGTGFHPELTGRENIFLNGAILGMAREEIKRKFDEIVAFAEVERFLDTPVKHYSSGMYLRLAFAVAAHLEPDILLVDEVLAVGDAAFQKKSMGKMNEVAREGRTVLFVSHSMAAVQALCSRTIWLESGCVKDFGESRQVVSRYLGELSKAETTVEFPVPEDPGREAAVVKAALKFDGESPNNGNELTISFTVQFFKDTDCNVNLYVNREGSVAFAAADYHNPVSSQPFGAGTTAEISFKIPKYLLNPGQHSFDFFLSNRGGNIRQIVRVNHVLPITIEDDNYRRGGQFIHGWAGAVSPLIPAAVKVLASDVDGAA